MIYSIQNCKSASLNWLLCISLSRRVSVPSWRVWSESGSVGVVLHNSGGCRNNLICSNKDMSLCWSDTDRRQTFNTNVTMLCLLECLFPYVSQNKFTVYSGVLQYVHRESCWNIQNLVVFQSKIPGMGFLKIHAPWNVLCREAEFMKLKMPTKKVLHPSVYSQFV